VKIGQMVTCNGYRNPALLAKMAATVDVMSHGRLLFGFGAGWYEHEWRAYGYGFPDVPFRMRMFREAVQIVHAMLTEDHPQFQGQHYTIDKPINEPKGVQQPRIPLWIGGGGEKVTLKLVAKYADGCNFGGGNVEDLRHKFDVLRQHCTEQNRNFDDLTRSTSINLHLLRPGDDPETATAQARGSRSFENYARAFWIGTPTQIVERLKPVVETGVNYIITYMPRVAYDQDMVRRFAQEVMPRVQ
jgi:alkanesulfonate monooxygenase SsuD/methylene tetrahydromethanopterin reductase-like flavin-dependent oxidoreductase (luciferase family)